MTQHVDGITPTAQEEAREQFIEAVNLAISELPDRSSPDDWPEAMLVTGLELRSILTENLDELLASIQEDARQQIEALEIRVNNAVVCAEVAQRAEATAHEAQYQAEKERDQALHHLAVEMAKNNSARQEGMREAARLLPAKEKLGSGRVHAYSYNLALDESKVAIERAACDDNSHQ